MCERERGGVGGRVGGEQTKRRSGGRVLLMIAHTDISEDDG